MPRARPKTPTPPHRCGFAAIVGRPNVGKSTLLNALIGTKVSIVTPKPQTTRHRILGILTRPHSQIIFVDTPGIHAQQRRVMNQYMNRSALSSLDADVLLFVVEALQWAEDDERALERVCASKRPVIALVNKVDRVREKPRLLPYLKELARRAEFKAIVPLSAQRRDSLVKLPKLIEELLPEGPALFPTDQVTDRSERFMAAEIIREKLTWRLREELPYGLTVEIERFEEQGARVGIGAIVWVERPGQKAIVIGAGGERLKEIGRLARLEINELLKKSVHLELWVKVKENWSDSEQALKSFGYELP
ncbi:MAG TPA: GTPase Era [Steroidobacteraceae bacterium]|nr:GTPase Era [Steroidobacteraceae bacterium]